MRSYASGVASQPLIGETIGENLERAVAGFGEREALVVRHQGMKAHRSTSPITTSVEPMTAMTSAIMPPMINFGSPWQA